MRAPAVFQLKDQADVAMAQFSRCRTWRYTLHRVWAGTDRDGAMEVAFVGLNPSTADEVSDDPTVRRCIGFAKGWGYDGMWMLNVFALRSTDPGALRGHPDPVGVENLGHILEVCTFAQVRRVVLCWGNHGKHMDQGPRLLDRLLEHGFEAKLRHLGLTGAGHPKHPLYLPKNTPLQGLGMLRYRRGDDE